MKTDEANHYTFLYITLHKAIISKQDLCENKTARKCLYLSVIIGTMISLVGCGGSTFSSDFSVWTSELKAKHGACQAPK